MKPNMPMNLASINRSQVVAWTTELEGLLRDPRVRKFSELREKIDLAEAAAFVVETDASPPSIESNPFDPYDAFEFAWDLTGQEVSTLELSKLAYGRFPDLSADSRRLMMHYLIDSGVAEVARTTSAGHPMGYRFGSPRYRQVAKKQTGLWVPDNELSALKAEDLEDLVVPGQPAELR